MVVGWIESSFRVAWRRLGGFERFRLYGVHSDSSIVLLHLPWTVGYWTTSELTCCQNQRFAVEQLR